MKRIQVVNKAGRSRWIEFDGTDPFPHMEDGEHLVVPMMFADHQAAPPQNDDPPPVFGDMLAADKAALEASRQAWIDRTCNAWRHGNAAPPKPLVVDSDAAAEAARLTFWHERKRKLQDAWRNP